MIIPEKPKMSSVQRMNILSGNRGHERDKQITGRRNRSKRQTEERLFIPCSVLNWGPVGHPLP